MTLTLLTLSHLFILQFSISFRIFPVQCSLTFSISVLCCFTYQISMKWKLHESVTFFSSLEILKLNNFGSVSPLDILYF